MIIFRIIGFLLELFMVFYVICDLAFAARDAKYQKLWRLKKSSLVRIDPAITRAELCEQYVIFCKENNCRVEF